MSMPKHFVTTVQKTQDAVDSIAVKRRNNLMLAQK